MDASRRSLWIMLATLAWLGCGRDPLLDDPLAGNGGGATGGTGGGDDEPGGAGGRDANPRADDARDARQAALDFRPGEVVIAIFPGDGPPLPVGQFIQLRAMVDLGGGLRDITLDPSLVWRLDDSGVAQVAERGGRLTGMAPGNTTVRVHHPDLGDGSAPVAVTAAAVRQLLITPAQPALGLLQSEQLVARATYSDGVDAEVTTAARWLSADQRIARVGTGFEPIGRVTGVGAGETVVTAEFAGQVSQATVTVSGTEATTLAISPMTGRGMVGMTVIFQAIARRSSGFTQNVSGQASWNSSNPSVATPLGGLPGSFRCSGTGTVTVTARYLAISTSATLECGGGPMQIAELRLTGANSDFVVGLSYRLSVQAFFVDGSQPRELMNNQVAWSSSDPDIAIIDSLGVLLARAVGTVTISASFGGVTGRETYTVKSR